MAARDDLSVPELKRRLQHAFAGPLPGGAAQRLLAPMPRPGWDPEQTAPPCRPAAVLALILPVGSAGAAGLLLTERTDRVAEHRGQISFPGGVIEAGEQPPETALRETREEIGIAVDPRDLLGRLSPLWIPATGFHVTPVVAALDARPALRINPHEVARILEVPVAELLRPQAVRLKECSPDGRWQRVPYFGLSGGHLWGATAMMVAELLVLLGWPGPDG